jgi:hypothetical protein
MEETSFSRNRVTYHLLHKYIIVLSCESLSLSLSPSLDSTLRIVHLLTHFIGQLKLISALHAMICSQLFLLIQDYGTCITGGPAWACMATEVGRGIYLLTYKIGLRSPIFISVLDQHLVPRPKASNILPCHTSM